MTRTGTTALIAAALAFTPAAISGASAQGNNMEQRQQQQPPASFDDAELKTYAKAAAAVQQISEEYRPQIVDADSREEQNKLRQEAQTAMVAAIEELDFSVREYNRISEAARANPQLASKIQKYMQ